MIITTKDSTLHELRHVQVQHPWIVGQGTSEPGQPPEKTKISIADIERIETKNPRTVLTILVVGCGGASLLYAIGLVWILTHYSK